MPTLIYNPGEPDEEAFLLGDTIATIGRADDQTIRIPHASLSPTEARLEPSDGKYFVVDVETRNATFVNGIQVQRRELHRGDTLTVGTIDLLFTDDVTLAPSDAIGGHDDTPPTPGDTAPLPPGDTATAPRRPASSAAIPLRPQTIRPLVRTPLHRAAHASEHVGEDTVAGRTARRRALTELPRWLPVTDDVDTLLRKTLAIALQTVSVDTAALLVADDRTGALTPRAVASRCTEPDEPLHIHQPIVDFVLHNRVAARFVVPPCALPAGGGSFARTVVGVPLQPRDDLLALLYVEQRSACAPLAAEDLDFLVCLASHAAVAIENATLYQRLERDVTERMQRGLDAKLATFTTLIAGIAHEIRNPLSFINNFAALSADLITELSNSLRERVPACDGEALLPVLETFDQVRNNSERITHHCRRADAIVQSMLQHARRPVGTREITDLHRVVREGLRLALDGAQGDDFEVNLIEDYDRTIGPLEMATLEMERVFLNVVDNALCAMRNKKRERGNGYTPELRICTTHCGDHVEVRIRDNGTGIPDEATAHLFEPFFTTKPPGQGIGLGLSLSHDIVVRGHRGTMRMETELGQWAELVITLPR
ncbi:ATP-binding protein [Chondromyces crocatus]|uniref:histidine kinase n=1 Tax=Chondromyces crocatus TaxID=52 RepID=A0A0K1EAZ4_CHOCO|nr:ATP-binding protein [Chondromyces crocatus]AKT37852.1 histidine kinase [Chondromyces crocatus]